MPPYSTLKTSSDSEIGLAGAAGEEEGFAAGCLGSVEPSHPASTPSADQTHRECQRDHRGASHVDPYPSY